MTRLILPLPPSKNASHCQTNEDGVLRRRKTADTKQFMHDAGWLCKAWMRESGWQQPPPGEKVVLRYWCYWGDSRPRDTGNLVDALLDALNGIAYVDDRYVLPQAINYEVDRKNPRVEIEFEVREAESDGAQPRRDETQRVRDGHVRQPR